MHTKGRPNEGIFYPRSDSFRSLLLVSNPSHVHNYNIHKISNRIKIHAMANFIKCITDIYILKVFYNCT